MRILITGSRGWNDREVIFYALRLYVGQDNTLVSGACPTGADRLCEEIGGDFLGWQVELHPADWDTHGRKAGFLRNSEMVALGADVCLAFISECTSPRCNVEGSHPSHGASHTADLAEKAGIPVLRYFA